MDLSFWDDVERAPVADVELLDGFASRRISTEVVSCAPVAFLGWPGLDTGWRLRDGKVEFNRNFVFAWGRHQIFGFFPPRNEL